MKSTNKSFFSFIAVVCIIAIVIFCSIQVIGSSGENNLSGGSDRDDPSDEITNPDGSGNQSGEDDIINIIIKAGDRNFTAILYNNSSVKAFLDNLPLEITMNELNGNEKYYYLPESLPVNDEHIKNIHSGDLMLYSSNCLVLFYENFSTNYSYTKLGYIENPEGLKEVLGDGDIPVSFSINW